MNYYETVKNMYILGISQKKYTPAEYIPIINIIIAFYMQDKFFTLDNCIEVFKKFLLTGILTLKNKIE